MPLQPLPLALPDVEFESFQLLNFGHLPASTVPSRFGFQLDVKPLANLHQVVFGMVQPAGDRDSAQRVGFAVRVDLERGEIWDLVNGSGLLGWLEEPAGCADGERQDSMLLSLEIERVGAALLPKLQIGGEEWLYPAIRCSDTLEFTAIAGVGQDAGVTLEECWTNPTLWSEDLRVFA